MDFLNVTDKVFLITGVANKKSVAYFVASALIQNGAKLILTVQSEEIKNKIQQLFPDSPIYTLNVENESEILQFGKLLEEKNILLSGFLHSIAFANYSEGQKLFHETKLHDYLQATTISSFSLVMIANAIKDILVENASIVTISISNTRATNYGYMGPIKASLDSTVAFLAKSLSYKHIRCNAICAGPLKTSASAGIPGYVNNYLFAEQLTMRKIALKTEEVANTILFLLSPKSSGINATGITVDLGMSANYFDENVVEQFCKR